jgi:hypothetical protein
MDSSMGALSKTFPVAATRAPLRISDLHAAEISRKHRAASPEGCPQRASQSTCAAASSNAAPAWRIDANAHRW